MAIIQNTNKYLIPSSHRDELVTSDRQSFEIFLKVFASIGGDVNDVTIHLMKKSIDERQITVEQIEKAVIKAYNQCTYKPRWADIINFIHEEPVPQYLTRKL